MGKMMDSINDLKESFRRGAVDIKQAVGIEDDPDVALYDKLDADQLQTLADNYGLENTIEYIQDMAFRKATKR